MLREFNGLLTLQKTTNKIELQSKRGGRGGMGTLNHPPSHNIFISWHYSIPFWTKELFLKGVFLLLSSLGYINILRKIRLGNYLSEKDYTWSWLAPAGLEPGAAASA